MKLYEFEGKGLFGRAGIKIPSGKVVQSPEEAAGLTKQFGAVMAKAQVLRDDGARNTPSSPAKMKTNWPRPSVRCWAESSQAKPSKKCWSSGNST